jgi:hypothetical protein
MKRPRPYIPISVRVLVAERQVRKIASAKWWECYQHAVSNGMTMGARLLALLLRLGHEAGWTVSHQLDHDPALILRRYNPRIKKVAARYTPDANDPDFLIYRPKPEHGFKTTGRKPGAERTVTSKGSDMWAKRKFDRLERKGTRPKRKIPSRPFTKQKRGFR